MLDYALGCDPAADSSAGMPGAAVRFSYTRRVAGQHDLVYQAECPEDPGTWQMAGLTDLESTPGPSPELEHVAFEFVPPGLSWRFLRLKVDQIP